MEYPKTIQIGGHIYKINLVDSYSVDDSNNSGSHHYGKTTIMAATKTCEGMPKSESAIMETICHEITHAINFVYCYSTMDENTVHSFSQGFYQVLSQLSLPIFKEILTGKPVREVKGA